MYELTEEKLNEIMTDLENPIYWDKYILGNGFSRLQLRQEWDKETNNKIRNRIIEALITFRGKRNE